MSYPPETTAALLKMREDWLKVVAIESPHGGFDIALVIDGTYSRDHYDPADLKANWAKRVHDALATDGLPLGVPISGCPNKAVVLGGEPLPALVAGPPDPEGSTPSSLPSSDRERTTDHE